MELQRRMLRVLAVAILACLAAAAPAVAQGWRPVVRSCATQVATTGCATPSPFDGAWNVAVSPDGKHAYAAAWDSYAVHIFNRNAATGVLTHKSGAGHCVSQGGAGGCDPARALTEPGDILFSPNGLHVYVVSWQGAVAIFDRDPDSGLLEQPDLQAGCISNGGAENCEPGHALGGHGAAMSANGGNIYVSGVGSLAVLTRNPDGTLEQDPGTAGCFGPAGCTPANGIGEARQIALSDDGSHLYMPSAGPRAILIFNRAADGALSQKPGGEGCLSFSGAGVCADLPQIGPFPQAAAISTDDDQVYLTSDDGIVTFRRLPDGRLAFRSCINDTGSSGCAAGQNVVGMRYLGTSPDGEDVVVNHTSGNGGLTVFQRNESTGDLTRRPGADGCITRNGRGVDNGALVDGLCRSHPTIGADGYVQFVGNEQIYAGFYRINSLADSSVASLKRDFLPVCRSTAVAVPHNTAVAVPLSCSDRNGDAMTLSASAPAAGLLGAIDQAQQRVLYNPFGGFSGGDAFTFFARAAGLQSAPATVSLSVAGSSGGGGLDADRDGFIQECNDNDPNIRPNAPEIRGNAVDENCDGVAAPFARITGVTVSREYAAFARFTRLLKIEVKGVPRGATVRATCAFKKKKCPGKARKAFTKRRARGTVSLNKRYKGVRLKVGTTITVTVTKPNMIGAVKILTIRKRKAPALTDRCLPPGARRAQRC